MSERALLAARAAKLGIWDWDIPADRLTWDDRMYELYGVTKESSPGAYEVWLKGVHPDDRARADEDSHRALIGEAPYDTNFRILLPDGGVRSMKSIGEVFRDAAGKPVRMIGVNWDVTENEKLQADLRANEERYRIISSIMSDITYSCRELGDGNYSIEWMAGATGDIVGYSAEEIKSRKCWRFLVQQEDAPLFDENVTGLKPGGTGACELRLQHKDGSSRWVSSFAKCTQEAGQYVLYGGLRDITERKKAEADLRQSNDLMENTQQLAKIGGWEWDIAGQTMHWTAETYRIHGLEPGDIRPSAEGHIRKSQECYRPEDVPVVMAAFGRCAETGEPYDLEFPFTPIKGGSLWVRTTGRAELENGKVKKVIGTIADITDKKLTELAMEKLNRELKDKNREMENFLYITTHDLRSPLVNIQGFSRNLERYVKEMKDRLDLLEAPAPQKEELEALLHGKIPEALDFVLGSSRRMDGLITSLLKVSRIGRVEMKVERLDMDQTLRKVLNSLRFQLEEARAEVKLGPLPPCMADSGAVSQIFTNLLDNAVKYRAESRTLKLEISAETKDKMVSYKVADNGPGIPQQDLARIWNVF